MSSLLKLSFIGLMGVAAYAQPSISSVVNAASNALAPVDSNNKPVGNNVIAEGAIFVIYGSNLGPTTLVQNMALPVPATLPSSNGTSASISAGGQTIAAYMVYTSAGQVAAILPSNTPVGPAMVTVTYGGQTSAPFPISVAMTAPGIITRNGQGNGPAVVQIYPDYSLNSLTNSAIGGDTLIIYATGFGPITTSDSVDPMTASLGSVTVNIAGQQVQGAAYRISPGLDQVNVTLPANVTTGCYVPAEITANGQPSNLFYLSIGAGSRTCVSPLGLNAAALAKLDAGGTVNVGVIQLLRAVLFGVPAEGAGAVFDTVNADGAFQMYNRILFSFGGVNFPVAAGSCAVLDTITPYVTPLVPDFSLIGGSELNAGNALTISGTNGNTVGVPRLSTGGYETVFFATLGKGTWTVSGTGGSGVGPFSAKTDLPDNFVWTNAGNFGTPPRSDFTITWTGGNLNSGALVTIFGSSVVINPSDPSKNRGKEFYCNAPASAGQFAVPASVSSQLPSNNGLAAGEIAFGALGVNAAGGSTFTAPLTAGGNLDGGYVAYGEAQSISVKWQ